MKPQEASSTAKVVAAAIVLLDSQDDTRHLLARDAGSWSKVFLSSSWSGRMLAASVGFPISRIFWRWVERCTLPGIMRHYACRKRWIEAHCRASFAKGYQRLVIIGAGFDTLGMRMAIEFPELHVTEIDHPATQRDKLAGMAMHGKSRQGNIEFVPLDLNAQGIPASLFPEPGATVFVMEGLLMYLSEERVRALWENIRTLPLSSSRVIASYMCRRPDGKASFTPQSRLIDWWLRMRNEPFRWSLTREEMLRFVESAGFSCLAHATGPEMADSDDTGQPLEGENFLLAVR